MTLLPIRRGSLSLRDSPHCGSGTENPVWSGSREPSAVRVTSTSQCSLINSLCDREGTENRRGRSQVPTLQEAQLKGDPREPTFPDLLCRAPFLPTPPQHTDHIHVCTQTDTQTAGTQTCTHTCLPRYRHTAIVTRVQAPATIGPEFSHIPLNQRHLPLAKSLNCVSANRNGPRSLPGCH